MQGRTASECVNAAYADGPAQAGGHGVDGVCPDGQTPLDASRGNTVHRDALLESKNKYRIIGP